MSEAQNTTGNSSGSDNDAGRVSPVENSTSQGHEEFESEPVPTQEDYYAVDDPKKDISTTIGDGEMRNEGLVGDGSIPVEDPLSPGLASDEQDAAELHDSEG